jgi:nitrate reductase molybdenum cofactor assembly chaperone NarJ/NarW
MRRATAQRVFGCASALLSYPDEHFHESMDAVTAAARRLLAGAARSQLLEAAVWLRGLTRLEAATTYVDTFDLSRRTCLYLTYYRHGDTRERGMALTALIDAYRAAGFTVATGELPDFLPALLELAAVHRAGATVLAEHRMALDALRQELEKANSRYAPVLGAVTDALPGPTKADRRSLKRYRAQGPPSERVGLEPFAPPETLGKQVVPR